MSDTVLPVDISQMTPSSYVRRFFIVSLSLAGVLVLISFLAPGFVSVFTYPPGILFLLIFGGLVAVHLLAFLGYAAWCLMSRPARKEPSLED